MSAPVTPYERFCSRESNLVFKSGPLYISSKGLGWKSWKRRWFILTRTSLVFFKSDPNVLPQKSNELNLTLGGIDLNNSGSVLVRADKKLLTVLFPDGRAFTLKAETLEDLEEWKSALERVLAAAPSAALVIGENGIFRNDSIDATEGSSEPGRDRRPVKSLVVGRPILLALEDIDGSPSFLEKALCFIEQHGTKVEGILRQSADVDEVEQRIHDYEQGKNRFSPEEDAHVVGDCIKHVLRELPSSPVPTPCCTALLEAYRVEGKDARIEAMRMAIAETFPEPNRKLLQRVLQMMHTVALHTIENRMTASAVAACMAPLLLRPLLAGECGLDDDTDISGDNAAQLLAAAAAANNAQAIITTLLEEYNNIFEDTDQVDAPSSQMSVAIEDSESEGSSDGGLQIHDNGYHDAHNDLEGEFDEDSGQIVSGAFNESSGNVGSDAYEYKVFEDEDSEGNSPKSLASIGSRLKKFAKGWSHSLDAGSRDRSIEGCLIDSNKLNVTSLGVSCSSCGELVSPVLSPRINASNSRIAISAYKTGTKSETSTLNSRRTSIFGPSSVTKNKVSTTMTDSSGEEEFAIQRLEATRNELRAKIAKEVKGNAILQASLERRKQALYERRIALEQDVARLQEQLKAERDLRAALEIGLSMSTSQVTMTHNLDSKARAELKEIALAEADVAMLKQKVAELHIQLSHHQQCGVSTAETSDRYQRVKSLQAQQKILQQELDHISALCQHEKQRNTELEEKNGKGHTSALEEVILQQRNALAEAKEALRAERMRGMDLRNRAMQQDFLVRNDWRMLMPPTASSAPSRQFAWRNKHDSLNLDPRKTDALATFVNEGSSVDEFGSRNGKRSFLDLEVSNAGAYHHQGVASSALVELTTRLDFFKERRSQLMEQLQNLDLIFAPSSLNGYDTMYS